MDSSPWPGPLALIAAIHAVTFTVRGFTGKDWGLFLALLVALVIAGLASASETALTSVNRIRIRNLAEEGDARAQEIERLQRDPNTFLSTILVVNSVAVIVSSTLATLLALDVFTSFGEIISTIALSLVVLIFCEITPKTAAIQSPERWARALVGPVNATTVVLRPLIAALTYVTNGIVRLFGGRTVRTGPFVTEEELRLLVEVGEEEGVLEEEEKEMIHNVFELGDTTVREVMVPRIDMVTIEADEPVNEAVRVIVQGGQSRIPVYSETIDNIIGVLYAKDLLRVMATNQRPKSVRTLVRPAYFVPETKRLDDLLRELQQQRVHMAIVNDEYGQVAGLVTIEDLVEEIIGDIQDEYDREEVIYEQLSPNEYIVNPKISLDDFNDLLDSTLSSEDYDTLGGFVYSQLDKIPSVGDVVRAEDLTITVLGTKGRRVTKVKVVRGPVSQESAGEGAGSTPRAQAPATDDQRPADEADSPREPPEAASPPDAPNGASPAGPLDDVSKRDVAAPAAPEPVRADPTFNGTANGPGPSPAAGAGQPKDGMGDAAESNRRQRGASGAMRVSHARSSVSGNPRNGSSPQSHQR
jgi:putative hemolysin